MKVFYKTSETSAEGLSNTAPPRRCRTAGVRMVVAGVMFIFTFS